jgi:hypothetical protein
LDKNTDLLFSLKKQQLIELIKAKKTDEAIKFAQTRLAPKCCTTDGGENSSALESHFQKELEYVMTLLMYDDIE